ncbi:hypothetical protein DICVIV_04580 [Dictyocaulus viviparus]|uniref:Cation/H+ exchanger transmembrane domain-containing protein n=1 Tax=Dictyocaulus viviparus TaxID=29172 RepID=A0A0D8XXA0_DICVI|nr:hypothetical protein DICVIV_04580 [Dictyocaulus viviparus]
MLKSNGCLLVGVLVRNIHVLNEIVEVHPKWEWCIRMLALTVIIIRCGISLSWDHLEEAMAITLSLGFLTAVVESAAIAIAAIFLLEWSVPIALICGFVLTAVSPAVVVPVMLELRNREPLFEIIGVTVAELVIGVLIGLFVGWILWWFPISYVVNSSVCRTLLLATVTSATVLGGNVLGFSSAGIVSATLICFVAGVRWKTDNDDKAALAPSITALAVSTTDLKDEIHTAKSSIEDMHYIGKTSNGITGIGIKATKLDDAIQSQRF